jgi:hypothetical protein
VSVPLSAWRQHIVSLLLTPADEGDVAARGRAEEVAVAFMAQRLGMGLLLNSTDEARGPIEAGPYSPTLISLTQRQD